MLVSILMGGKAGKDRSYTPHEASSQDWQETPKARRQADEHPSDFESDDDYGPEDPAELPSDTGHSRDEHAYKRNRTSTSSIPRPTTIPYISINGHRSVSLSRARSTSVSSTESQNEPLEDADDLPESEPEHTSSRLSYAYSTPRSAYHPQPATARRIKDTTSRTVDQVRFDDEQDHTSHTRRSTTPVESPGHGLKNESPRYGHQSVDRSTDREHNHIQRSTTPNDSPGHHLRYEESSRSRSPLSSEQPTSMNRSSSLQNIDNTYHIDASERNASRGGGGASTPASVKKQSSSSSYLSVASSFKSSKSSSSASSPRSKRKSEQQETWKEAKEEQEVSEALSQPSPPRMKPALTSTRFMSASPPWSPVDEEQSHLQRRVAKRASAELNTDKRLALAGETPLKMRSMFPAGVNEYEDSYQTLPRPSSRASSRQQEKQPESPPPTSKGGHNLLDDRTPPSFHDVSLTPPRNSSTPKNHAAAAAREPKSPSSAVVLPDLPTPSSSDESETEHEAQSLAQAQQRQRGFATPKHQNGYGNGYEASWMPTPKPPGGWLQTPMPARHAHVREASERNDGGYADESEADMHQQQADSDQNQDEQEGDAMVNDPKTPLRQPQQEYGVSGTTTKTPRFPGAWRTPGLTPAPRPKQSSPPPSPPSAPPHSSSSSLHPPSQAHAQEQRHQGLLTPVNSLSRAATSQLDPKTPYVTGGWVNTPAARKSILKVRFTPKEDEDGDAPDNALMRTAAGAPPSTPHRSIRVLDAFGREQPVEDDVGGVEVKEEEEEEDESRAEDSSEPSRPMSRADVLQDIRRKINTLVEDIEDIDSETKFHDDERVRIEELSAVSRRARDRRAQLQSESGKALVKPRFRAFSPNMFSTRVGLRFYFILFLVQVFIVLLMYRLSAGYPQGGAGIAQRHTMGRPDEQTSRPTSPPPTPPPLSHQESDYPGKCHSDSESNSASSTDEGEIEHFDWSEDEATVNENENVGTVRAKRGRRLWLALMKLSLPVRVLLIGAIGCAILITPLLVVNIRFNGSPVKQQVHSWSLWLTIIFASSCATFLVVEAIPKIVILLSKIFGANVERLTIQVELTMAVKSWIKLLLSVVWAWISLSIIRAAYHPPGNYWTIIARVMSALFAASIVLFIEKLFLQFVAVNFHQKAVADRLAENQLALRALDRLSAAPIVVPPKKTPNFKRGHKTPGSAGSTATFDGVTASRRTQKQGGETPLMMSSGDSTPPKGAAEYPGFPAPGKLPPRKKKKNVTAVIVDQVGGAIGQVALKNSKFNKQIDLSGVHSARKLARKLFGVLSNVDPRRSHLIVDDFHPYFRTTAEAAEAFAVFDKDGNGDISKREMREAVSRIYQERKALIRSLKDVSSIVAKLDAVLLFIALIVVIFICMLIFNRSNTVASLVPLATIVLGFSFIFGNSAATLFNSYLELHGGTLKEDSQVLFVKEFGLFATTFRRVDGQEVIAPNALLSSSKLVHNLRRSKSMWETTELVVSFNTPMELIEQLKQRIQAYITANNREWSDSALNIDKMDYMNDLCLIVAIEHRPNWQDWGGRWARRTQFMRHLKTILEDLDIRYTMPVQPVLMPRGEPMHAPQPGRGASGPPTGGLPSFGGDLNSPTSFHGGEFGTMPGPAFTERPSSF
ncbi:hypothetical protein D9619_001370 [Psilocybe cf. subviscida]|uniref:EF-hand domain-containing protein n=1 Tax=Psilocybe cf. subviscida TaxID=2480587 RepID=A0A8H5BFV2_9AGAR|nr:hypothetical protein D9619_001370 [Psilocybe cf. subviscida]